MTEPRRDPVDLRSLWIKALRRHDELRAECESRATRWVWTTSAARWARRPYHDERMGGLPPGRELTDLPGELEGVDRYGYDSEGRLAVAYTYTLDEIHDRYFFTHDSGCERRHSYDFRGNLVEVAEYRYDEDRVVEIQSYAEAPLRWRREEYDYFRCRLIRVRTRSFDESEPSRRLRDLWDRGQVELFAYGYDGELASIVARFLDEAEHPERVYQRPGRELSLDALIERVRVGLIEAIPRAVAAAHIQEPVWALALQYEPEAAFPPGLAACTQSEREALSGGLEVLNPAEWLHVGEIPFPVDELGVGPDCDLLTQELRLAERNEDARQVLNQIARELDAMDWRGALRATDDFLVYAVDLELVHLEKNLKKTHADRYAELESLAALR